MAERPRHALHDGGPEAHALGAELVARLEAPEFLENVPLEMLRRDAGAGVPDLDGEELAMPAAA
ncbi:hypothetical protein THITH_15165 [Thioalkalivibrio paradoxus ARh 1]|uniref:Uncharacterized protein n=1 Tax=Thioalkalivibrio paradoxus ARh 1 TaxID=713585 RepID=W0DP95_9GAMM|nr:hypothetical protein [Thioalkalivibrio paradoxus]AHF00277.1 hypothetical protein THITH_15165 [Thioalkalivibrio paradoxus ARh 1]